LNISSTPQLGAAPPTRALGFQSAKGIKDMPVITTKDGIEIFYKDWGSGRPIVFSHGWPLSG
jgi:hypothetical protein